MDFDFLFLALLVILTPESLRWFELNLVQGARICGHSALAFVCAGHSTYRSLVVASFDAVELGLTSLISLVIRLTLWFYFSMFSWVWLSVYEPISTKLQCSFFWANALEYYYFYKVQHNIELEPFPMNSRVCQRHRQRVSRRRKKHGKRIRGTRKHRHRHGQPSCLKRRHRREHASSTVATYQGDSNNETVHSMRGSLRGGGKIAPPKNGRGPQSSRSLKKKKSRSLKKHSELLATRCTTRAQTKKKRGPRRKANRDPIACQIALDNVWLKKMSVNAAATSANVSRSNLRNWVNANVRDYAAFMRVRNLGFTRYFDDATEEELVAWVREMAAQHFCVTIDQFRRKVEEVLDTYIYIYT